MTDMTSIGGERRAPSTSAPPSPADCCTRRCVGNHLADVSSFIQRGGANGNFSGEDFWLPVVCMGAGKADPQVKKTVLDGYR
jgi:hypothetical protein